LPKLILVSSPSPDAIQSVLDGIGDAPFRWTYLGQSILEHLRVSEQVNGRGEYLDTSDRFHHWTQELREPYLKYLFDIGQDLASLHWWFTPMSWRDSFVSNGFLQACHLKTGLELVESWNGTEALVLVADEPVCRSIQSSMGDQPYISISVTGSRRRNAVAPVLDILNMLGHRSVFVLREMYQIFQSRRKLPKPVNPAGGESLLISWGTSTSILQGGEFHRFFFGDLADRLAFLKEKVVIVPMILKDVRYNDALRLLEKSPLPICLPHSVFGIIDPIKAAISSFRKPADSKLFPRFAEMDIAPLFEGELNQYWVSNQPASLLMKTLLVRRWAEWSPSITRIIYMYENKPWERAICWQADRSLPNATLVGYSPTPVSKLLLNFFLAPGEAKIAPLPDRFVTVGKQPARLLASGGYDSETVMVGGALRMQDLDALRSPDQDIPEITSPVVLLAPTLGVEESAELAYMALNLFEESDGVQVILKCHPMMPFDNISDHIGGPLPSHVQISNKPIKELILQSSVMIYSTSTVCIEALAVETPVVNLRPQFGISLDPLEEFTALRPVAVGLNDLREKVKWILEHREEHVAQNKDAWAEMVKDMFSPVTSESIQAFI
jgi:hypothetical protein